MVNERISNSDKLSERIDEHAERFKGWREETKATGFQMFSVDLASVMYELTADQWRDFTWLMLRGNHETGQCFHGVETMAAEWGVNERSVLRRLASLVDVGAIERVPRPFMSTYTLLTPWNIGAKKDEASVENGEDTPLDELF